MISSGYLKFSRGWKNDSRSPLYGAKRRDYYLVWRELCEQAGYGDEFGMAKGELSISLRKLAEETGVTRGTCANAIRYLVDQSLVEVASITPQLRITIKRYDYLDCLGAYFGWSEPEVLADFGAQQSPPKSWTAETPDKVETIQDKTPVEKTELDSTEKSWTRVGHLEGDLTMRDDEDNECIKNEQWTALGQNSDILKNKEYRDININNYSAKSDGAVPPSIAYRRKAGGDLVSDFDHEIAKTWANRMKAADKERAATSGKPLRERRPSLAKWAKVISEMRTIDQLTEDDIRLILETRFSDDFYRTTDMCPGNLRSKAQNGHPKWFNILSKGKRTPEENNAPTSLKTALKPKRPKVNTLEEILG